MLCSLATPATDLDYSNTIYSRIITIFLLDIVHTCPRILAYLFSHQSVKSQQSPVSPMKYLMSYSLFQSWFFTLMPFVSLQSLPCLFSSNLASHFDSSQALLVSEFLWWAMFRVDMLSPTLQHSYTIMSNARAWTCGQHITIHTYIVTVVVPLVWTGLPQ